MSGLALLQDAWVFRGSGHGAGSPLASGRGVRTKGIWFVVASQSTPHMHATPSSLRTGLLVYCMHGVGSLDRTTPESAHARAVNTAGFGCFQLPQLSKRPKCFLIVVNYPRN
eukprot:1070275-Pelagomonas_calceolata.AAC.1